MFTSTKPSFFNYIDWGTEYKEVVEKLLRTDALHTEKESVYKFNLAGTDKKDISISTKDDLLIVTTKGNNVKSYRVDFNNYDMSRSTAEYKDGLLTIKLPRAAPETHTIEIS